MAAPFDFVGLILAVETMVNALPTITSTSAQVYIGASESIEARINAWVTLGSFGEDDGSMGGSTAQPAINVVFGYAVGGNERAAELAIGALVLELITAVKADPTIGGKSDNPAVVDTSRADLPDYQGVAGAEARVYPCVIRARQQQ